MADAGRVAIRPKGDFENGTSYKRLDLIRYENGIYIAKEDNIYILPTDDTYWMFSMGTSEFQPDGITIESDENGNLSVITGMANGVAGLDEDGKVPEEQLPDEIVNSEFESGDALNPENYTNVELIGNNEPKKSFMEKVSTMVKNVRYLYKMLGTTDISSIGNGTITGAINQLNTGLEIEYKGNDIFTFDEGVSFPGVYFRKCNNVVFVKIDGACSNYEQYKENYIGTIIDSSYRPQNEINVPCAGKGGDGSKGIGYIHLYKSGDVYYIPVTSASLNWVNAYISYYV